MTRIDPYPLWIGHAGDDQDFTRVCDAGIEAIVDLAAEEPPALPPRDLIVCRVPLVDGPGNPLARLSLAVHTVAALAEAGIPTMVCCGAGLSRSPAVIAAALALAHGGSPGDWLARVAAHHHGDVSPGLWADLVALGPRATWPTARLTD